MENILIETFNKRRVELMGVAILLVLLYHLYCASYFHERLKVFQYGFIGVDFFMVLSGYGLCFAYKKYDIKGFYKRRCARILPLFWIQALVYVVSVILLHRLNVAAFSDKTIDVWLIVKIFTTYSFWEGGDIFFNWYVSAIFFLYLIFPLFFFIARKMKVLAFVFVCIVAYLTLSLFRLEWQWDCFVSRIPMFLLGILCYRGIPCKGKIESMLLVSVFFWLLLTAYGQSVFYMVSSVSIVLMFVIGVVLQNDTIVNNRIRNILIFCGKHSYEIYISNYFTMTVVKLMFHSQRDIIGIVILYVASSIIFALGVILLSRLINKMICS